MNQSRQVIQRLQKIVANLQASSLHEKRSILEKGVLDLQLSLPVPPIPLPDLLHEVWLSLILIDQSHLLEGVDRTDLVPFLQQLVFVEQFYASLGGIVGYHLQMLSLLFLEEPISDHISNYHPPKGVDISEESEEIDQFVQTGLDSLPRMAEIYVVGGAADRLRPYDPVTQDSLPAALFSFSGYPLLEWLIRDLEAREYLYREKWGQRVVTPIAMMTSPEKNNHEQILSFCEKKNWFGRGKENIRFFEQPVVPTMDSEGKWCALSPGQLLMKPGGHGVLWKLAQEKGIFSWMKEQKRTKVLIRQINNPIAGIDRGLLAFCGVGFARDKQFGFASCLRRVASAEGVNVLIEKERNGFVKRCLTNIEYCDFEKFSIQDVPLEPGGAYSRFPSNTNILFADIDAVEKKIKDYPIPGMLVNKKKVSFKTLEGEKEQEVVRLESTMQNLADAFESSESDDQAHPTFLTYHERHKTISAIKKRLGASSSLLETPEGCLFDWLKNMHELLSSYCQMELPLLGSESSYLEKGPPFLFFYHPALGPLFSKIATKIMKGRIGQGSEVRLEIADLLLENLEVAGALSIEADPVLPTASQLPPRVVLKHVKVSNCGLKEKCSICIEGDGEFYAEGITLSGHYQISVKAGTRMTALKKEGCLEFIEEKCVSVLGVE